MMPFEEQFTHWLNEALTQTIPASVVAFAFNLFQLPETAEFKFGIELIGAASFDESDSDWACDELWEPRNRKIEIPTSFSGHNWEECLVRVKNLLISELEKHPACATLKSKQAVAIGFVDGDLDLIWLAE